jgi:uncharacterized protein (DUF1015 family)
LVADGQRTSMRPYVLALSYVAGHAYTRRMAEVRPFRALRYTSRTDPALAIAPPYDVISPAEQAALYERSPYNVVRIEYGVQRESDTPSENRYTRAGADLTRWREEGLLALDASSAVYIYTQEFGWEDVRYRREAYFCALRLESWDKGIVKPHEHTLAKPKADRLDLIRATRTQVSPVYSLFRPRGPRVVDFTGETLMDFEADGQRHTLAAMTDAGRLSAFEQLMSESDVYIADGHHRYETALAYRDEVRARAASWTGDEPENFVLMALTAHDDPGLLVLPTHRLVHRDPPGEAIERISRAFEIEEAPDLTAALRRLADRRSAGESAFVVLGMVDGASLITLKNRDAVESLMPAGESDAWKRLDVNVLQYGVLQDIFGIDDSALTAGGAVTYTQDAAAAQQAVARGEAKCAFLINATPVDQVLAVSDANGRMPQKSTYFYPKLPTGLVLRVLE